jgi:radical SAM superfamily enzyme YgiQ (UPF0313 family)
MKNGKIILFNPRSANSKYRIPNSILQLGATLDGKYEYIFIDGNREKGAFDKIENVIKEFGIKYFACTVMPGPQLQQAIPYSKRIRELYPEIIIIWGGYFPSNHYKVSLESGFVDYIISGPGDSAFPALLDSLENNQKLESINNLIYKKNNEIIKTSKEPLLDQDSLPQLPYNKLNAAYSLDGYLGKTFLGSKTLAYHSSIGCPFSCSFCAVVPIYNAKWKGKSAINIYKDVKYLNDEFGADAIEFHDNNFFVSEKRTVESAELILPEKMNWWGEARVDTLDKYSDESLKIMRDSGCKMIFLGAETGSDQVLKQMNKGGTQSGEQIKNLAIRLGEFDIIPEYSFVLGIPAESSKQVWSQINEDIKFIKEIKKLNPKTEIIIYIYSPIPLEGSDLFEDVVSSGFKYPEKLEDWLSPAWEKFDGRKNPLTPWLNSSMIKKISNFETVLNARYPTISDTKLKKYQKRIISFIALFRYRFGFYAYPLELRFLQSRWLHYCQPEVEGF